jgi:hypothetical protein
MRPDRRQLLLFSGAKPPIPAKPRDQKEIARDEKLRAIQELARWWRSKR